MIRIGSVFAGVSIIAVGLMAHASFGATAVPKPGENFSAITTNGIWTWYGEPKAVYYEGTHKRTYIGWNDSTGTQHVGYYDHETNTTTSVVLPRKYPADDHNHPSVIVRPDGRIMIFHTGHDGKEISEYISRNPEDLSVLDTFTVRVLDWCCYPNVCFLKNEGTQGRYYLFFRDLNQEPWFRTSDDWGKTWATEKNFYTNNPKGYKPYTKYHSNGVDEIAITIERENRAGAAKPTYFMKYKNGAFYKANGVKLGTVDQLPIVNTTLDTLVYPGFYGCGGTVWDVAMDSKGNPIVVYDMYKGAAIHIYWYYRWTGTDWYRRPLLNSGNTMGAQNEFAGGITLDHENPNIVYLSHQTVKAGTGTFNLYDTSRTNYSKNLTTASYVITDSAFEISRWTTCNGGVTWDSADITANSAAKNCRPCVPRGHKASEKINCIWLDGIYTSMGGAGYKMAVRMYPVAEPIPTLPTCLTGVRHETIEARFTDPNSLPKIRAVRNGFGFALVNPERSGLKLYSVNGSLAADLSNAVRAMSAGPGRLRCADIPSGMYVAEFNDGNTISKSNVILTR
jgi:hypothetical protein